MRIFGLSFLDFDPWDDDELDDFDDEVIEDDWDEDDDVIVGRPGAPIDVPEE